jgi:hypothetical protein
METTQALQIIQNIINVGIQKGLFGSIDDVTTAAIAFKTIENELAIKETKEGK